MWLRRILECERKNSEEGRTETMLPKFLVLFFLLLQQRRNKNFYEPDASTRQQQPQKKSTGCLSRRALSAIQKKIVSRLLSRSVVGGLRVKHVSNNLPWYSKSSSSGVLVPLRHEWNLLNLFPELPFSKVIFFHFFFCFTFFLFIFSFKGLTKVLVI